MQPIIDYFTKIPRKKLVVGLLVTFFVLVAIIFSVSLVWNNYNSQKIVTLNPSPGTTIAIGEQSGDEPTITKQIASTNTLKKVTLPVGNYAVKFTGSSDYQDKYISIFIDKPTEIKTPNLMYTNEKLNKLLISEKPAIQSVIKPVLPNQGYQIDHEAPMENGNWYGARLIPGGWYASPLSSNILPGLINEDNTEDMLLVILKKENGGWKLMAGPSIIFWIDNYPNIPQDIIRATNKLGFY